MSPHDVNKKFLTSTGFELILFYRLSCELTRKKICYLQVFHTCYMASLPRGKLVIQVLVSAQVLRISAESKPNLKCLLRFQICSDCNSVLSLASHRTHGLVSFLSMGLLDKSLCDLSSDKWYKMLNFSSIKYSLTFSK